MLFEDASGVFDLAASEVLELLKAIEPASTLANLSNPWPDLLLHRVDRNRVIRRPFGIGDELVARKGLFELFGGRSPSPASRAEKGSQ